MDDYVNFENVMEDGFMATRMYDALILDDSSGGLTELQSRAQAEFSKPKRLSRRLGYWIERTKDNVNKLSEDTASADPSVITLHIIMMALGSADLGNEEALAQHATITRLAGSVGCRSGNAKLADYFSRKAKYKLDKGLLLAGSNLMWAAWAIVAMEVESSETVISQDLFHGWLQSTGWKRNESLKRKLKFAHSILKEI
jgi:hypothetical protein